MKQTFNGQYKFSHGFFCSVLLELKRIKKLLFIAQNTFFSACAKRKKRPRVVVALFKTNFAFWSYFGYFSTAHEQQPFSLVNCFRCRQRVHYPASRSTRSRAINAYFSIGVYHTNVLLYRKVLCYLCPKF